MVMVKINGRAFQSPVAAISIANGNSIAATALLEMVSVNTTVRIYRAMRMVKGWFPSNVNMLLAISVAAPLSLSALPNPSAAPIVISICKLMEARASLIFRQRVSTISTAMVNAATAGDANPSNDVFDGLNILAIMSHNSSAISSREAVLALLFCRGSDP